MNKETLEHLSSLMDGELSRETGMFLTSRLSSDDELGSKWQRYHLIRDCMRQPGAGLPIADFPDRMKQALADEADHATHSGNTRPGWLKPVAGFAIAASVALMAIFAAGPALQTGPADSAEVVQAQPFSSPNTLPLAPATQAASFNSGAQSNDSLNSYLLRHNQLARSTGRQGFVSFVPIISSVTEDESNTEVDEAAAEPVGSEESAP